MLHLPVVVLFECCVRGCVNDARDPGEQWLLGRRRHREVLAAVIR